MNIFKKKNEIEKLEMTITSLMDILDEIDHGYNSPVQDFTLVRNGLNRYNVLKAGLKLRRK